MKTLAAALLAFSLATFAHLPMANGFSRKAAEPTPAPSVIASPSPSPTPDYTVITEPPGAPKRLAYFGPYAAQSLQAGGSDYAWGQRALAALNEAYASGCLLETALAWDFKSLYGVINPTLKPLQKTEAMVRYFAGAPYALEARWYSTRKGVIGYTYNFLDGASSGPSETRIWSNTRLISSEYDYAAHLAHELSHQARAGGFVHYTFHEGSFPYEIGDIAAECIYPKIPHQKAQLMVAMRVRAAIPDTSGCYR